MAQKSNDTGKEDRSQPDEITKKMQAEASSANSRINIPFNIEVWRDLDQEATNELSWFHQYLLENNLNYKDAEEAIGYDRSTIFRVLKNTYQGRLDKVIEKIKSFHKIQNERVLIKHAEFRETSITKLVSSGLAYALQNESMTVIVGESRMGKTATAKWWRDRNNHGRSVFITAPAYGGPKALLEEIAFVLGINRNLSMVNMLRSIYRAMNKNRILMVDEAHRLLPDHRTAVPRALEILRDLHDRTGCALALLATDRFNSELEKGAYQYEQILGRIGMPVRLPREFKWEHIKPIVTQYLPNVSAHLRKDLMHIANNKGRLGILCETLKVASKMANKKSEEMTEDHVLQAIALRKQMMGEPMYAKKL